MTTRQAGRLSSGTKPPAKTSYAIYGNAGIAGAILTYDDSAVEADASGNYIIIVPAGWSGTVTPTLTGYTFTPESKSYTDLAASVGGEDYVTTIELLSKFALNSKIGRASCRERV